MNFRSLAACLALLALPLCLQAAEAGPVVIIPVKSEVSEAQFFFVRRALKQSERLHASAVVLDLETFGGEVQAAIGEMDALMKSTTPTFTYVNPRAISAGALIALATQKIYMAPTAVIGAAAPVTSSGEDLAKTMADKTVSAMSAMARAAAQRNGHNADLAEAFISKDKEVKIGAEVIHPPGGLLTLSATEAARTYDGRPLLADGVADSLDAMLQMAGFTGPQVILAPTGFEQMAFWITALAPLFLLGGILGAYIEFKTPGFGAPGIIAACCFLVFFTGHYLAGLAGWEVGVLFLIGLLLVIGELVLHPGTVLPGVLGAMLMAGSLLWAMIDRYPGEPWMPSSAMLMRPLLNLGVAVAVAIFAGYWLAKLLPHTTFYQRLVLANTVHGAPAPPLAIPPGAPAIGQQGIARSMLRPSGKAEFSGHTCDVISEGDFIDPGAEIRVVTVDGLRVVVARA